MINQINKPTLVIGASANTERYSNMAINKLLLHNHTVYAIGNKAGNIATVKIKTNTFDIENINTVTLYINPTLQKNYYDYIIKIKPQRIIFNPGTENKEFENIATQNGISCLNACTLVMLQTNQY